MSGRQVFGDFPEDYSNLEKARIVIVPVPYDETSTWIKGADKGPAAIFEASANLEYYDLETGFEVCRLGIATEAFITEKSSPEAMVAAVQREVAARIRKEQFPVVIGGEHSVSIGAVAAHVENVNDLTVVQLDAHSDLREEYNGSRYNHACVMARIRQMCPIVQVGIRSMDYSEKKTMAEGRVFFAKDIYNQKEWITEIVTRLSPHVYITIDLDVFDPAVMPSTGTPEPGGLFWYDILPFLKTICERREVVGFDVVELCPNPANKAPDFLAAKLVYTLLSYKFGGGNNTIFS
ncbi:MAG: agmatinase [Deltaproteobacteria bacterium]|nr:agmatinase [Deltaproteobacteria bacterium]